MRCAVAGPAFAVAHKGERKKNNLPLRKQTRRDYKGSPAVHSFDSEITPEVWGHMWNVKEIFVVSDLHLAAERNSGFFQADEELVACLRWIVENTEDTVLVLAGDTLDFLAKNKSHQEHSFDRLSCRTERIVSHHMEVFEALAELIHSPRHRLVIMAGSYDSELIFPTVQEVLERQFGFDFLAPGIGWLVHGEALRVMVGNAVVVIEHGNGYDGWNRIDHAALHNVVSAANSNPANLPFYEPPLGHRLVTELITELHKQFPWTDSLRPPTEVVLPLLWRVGSPRQRELILNLAAAYLRRKTQTLHYKYRRASDLNTLYRSENEVKLSQEYCVVNNWFQVVSLQQGLCASGACDGGSQIEELRLLAGSEGLVDVRKPDDKVDSRAPIFESGANLVISGHTHTARASLVEGGLYINTGTWGEQLQVPTRLDSIEIWEDFLARLRANSVSTFRRLTFARVRYRPKYFETRATLLAWEAAGPVSLAESWFRDNHTGWRWEG